MRQVAADGSLATREERVRRALYAGAELNFANPAYMQAVRGIVEELLRQDTESGDLSVEATGIRGRICTVEIRAKERGVAAGIEEAAWLYEQAGIAVQMIASDGDSLREQDVLLRVRGDAAVLLSLERAAVNLLQRMSGIATQTRRLVEMARKASPAAHIAATRKTPWGLLDKKAVHRGGGGTHRLSLGDAILIKTNHLLLASNNDYGHLIRRAWSERKNARFFEVEVTAPEQAEEVARMIAAEGMADSHCPCMLMLDNFAVSKASATAQRLRKLDLHENVLLEASGNMNEQSVAEYAATGVDVISAGALTHSARALDLSAKIIP